jgi:hypothetical protein
LSQFVVHSGWKLKPKPSAFLLLFSDHQSKEGQIYPLKEGEPIRIKRDTSKGNFCVGYSTPKGERIPCPSSEQLSLRNNICTFCSSKEFFTCKIFCKGNVCMPSGEQAKEYCWRKKCSVYLTHVGGQLKVGSSTNPFRRWLGQGSDIGIVIAEGTGLEPRALEHYIATRLSLHLSSRVSQKLAQLGKPFNKEKKYAEILDAIELVYSTINSDLLLAKSELVDPYILTNYYGKIPELSVRPLMKDFTKRDFQLSGIIVGVKGSILVVRNSATYFALNLHTLPGSYIFLDQKIKEEKGQQSLAEYF